MLYTVRLESPTTSQWRLRTVDAAGEVEAQQMVETLEANRARYSLLDPRPAQLTVHEHDDGNDATVNLDALVPYADRHGQGQDLLDWLLAAHAVEKDGKVHGPDRAVKEHLSAHYQAEPFKIATVEPILPDVAQLIQGLKWLHGNEDAWGRMLERLKDEGIPLAVVTAALYGVPWQKQIDGSAVTVWSSATIQCSLHTAYTMDPDTHDFYNDVSATEITGTGYTALGATLASKTSTYDTATDQVRLDAADTSWTTSTLSATDAIVWANTAGASTTDPVLGAIDFGSTVTTTAGTFLITWDATGIVNFDLT